ncbi:hypothetical protein [Sphingomicrobium lutaoense]|uniref:MobA-like NTP transferase domain-containing protein n=1 Tax=Sphingomicrobium lutaoense TaxID=515949 RepID=A0A839Z2J4_9SPHN|nr:hypothetical protein [Sphingomicrobium lutaoense]MBB3763862.1 hypothetical protein [Sphingomicrobium lutaoense]
MALAALIGAYEEEDKGGLRALLPIAGRPLVEMQLRCAAAQGASPLVLLVDTPPRTLVTLADRLRGEGLNIVLAEGAEDAAARFEPETLVIVMADGVVPDMNDLDAMIRAEETAVVTVPDDERHEPYERIDLERRWAGLSIVEGREIGATAAMLGDWDLPSTLLRRMVQAGCLFIPSATEEGKGPLWVASAADGEGYSRRLLAESRGARTDWVTRYLLPPVEDALTRWLASSHVRPATIMFGGHFLTIAAIVAFFFGHGLAAIVLLLLGLPFDLVARRVAALRLKPIAPDDWRDRLQWPLSAVLLAALAAWRLPLDGWGIAATALAQAVIAEALRPLRRGARFSLWLFDRRPAILLLLPFAIAGAWAAGLIVLMGYAGASLIIAQRFRSD